MAARLPVHARYPEILAHGSDGAIEWLIVRRVAGTELSRAWPGLSRRERCRAVSELAQILAVVHAVDASGLPEDRDMSPPHVLPLDRILDEIDRLATVAFMDCGLLGEVASFLRGVWGAFDPIGRGLVHGDPHLERVCERGRITALLDFEWSRRSWIEVDLESRLCSVRFRHGSWPRSTKPRRVPRTTPRCRVGSPRPIRAGSAIPAGRSDSRCLACPATSVR